MRRPEIGGLIAVAALLNLWALGRNGWANTYYSAAVRSMASSWHNFLYASMDPSGVMTVDKPPLSLWVQAISVRIFGYHPLAMLVPQALMGVACVVLVYDLVRRRFGRVGGFVAGLALATTPIAVAMSRHNNPDELLDTVLDRGGVVRRARVRGRPHALARPERRRGRAGLRDEDGASRSSSSRGSRSPGCGSRREGGPSRCANCSRVAPRCWPSAARGRCSWR